MKNLLFKRVVVQKSYDDIYDAIVSCSYRHASNRFCEDSFLIHVLKRYNGGTITLIPVSGHIVRENGYCEVFLNVNANLLFWAGTLLIMFGIVGFVWCLLSSNLTSIPFIGMIGMGIISLTLFFSDAIYCIRKIERRLHR